MNSESYQPVDPEATRQQFELITQFELNSSSIYEDIMRELDTARSSYDQSFENFQVAFTHYALSPNPSFENDTLDEAAGICIQSIKALLYVVTKRIGITNEQAAMDASHILTEELNKQTSLMNYAKNSEDDLELSTASKYFDVISDEVADGEINKVDQIVELAGDIYGVELNRVLDSAKRFYVKLSLS